MKPTVTVLLAVAVATGAWACEPDSLELEDDGVTAVMRLIQDAQAKQPAELTVDGEVVRGRAPNAEPSEAPKGYLLMKATARSGPAFGDAILLIDESGEKVVPIFVGGTEALSIRLRLIDRRYPRPLTHDLMDETIKKLDAKVLRAQVDALKDNVFIGTLVLKRGDEVIQLDARPSDAMAMAIGNGVPIYVASEVVEEAGIALDKLDDEKPRPVDPISL